MKYFNGLRVRMINRWLIVAFLMLSSQVASIVTAFLDSTSAYADSSVQQVSTGQSTACAILSGTVRCWGSNSAGQLGTGDASSTASQTTPVAVAVNKDPIPAGSTVCTSNILGACLSSKQSSPAIPASALAGKYVDKVSVGTSHVCALAAGSVYCWGDNSHGELGNHSNSNSSVPVAVATNTNSTPAIPAACTSSFLGLCLSYGPSTPAVPVSALANKKVIDIAAGDYFTCALADDGSVACWGDGADGRLGVNGTATTSSSSSSSNTATNSPVPTTTPTPTPSASPVPTPSTAPSATPAATPTPTPSTSSSNNSTGGTTTISPSPASSSSSVATLSSVLEAENLTLSPVNSKAFYSDSTASGGQAVKMAVNSTSSSTVQTGSVQKIGVTARGNQCVGAPTMQIKVDSKVVGSQAVDATSWKEYSFPVTLSAGSHKLEISYTNQFSLSLLFWNICTRALYLDKATITSSNATAALGGDSQVNLASSESVPSSEHAVTIAKASGTPTITLAQTTGSSSRSARPSPTPTPTPVASTSATTGTNTTRTGSSARPSTSSTTTTSTTLINTDYNSPQSIYIQSGSALFGKKVTQLAKVSDATMCVLAGTTSSGTPVYNSDGVVIDNGGDTVTTTSSSPYCWGYGIDNGNGMPQDSSSTVVCSRTSPTGTPTTTTQTTISSSPKPVQIPGDHVFTNLDSNSYVTALGNDNKAYYWGMYGYNTTSQYTNVKTCKYTVCTSYVENMVKLAGYTTTGTRTVSTGSGSVTPHYQGTATPGTTAGGSTTSTGGGGGSSGSTCHSVTHYGYTKNNRVSVTGKNTPTVPPSWPQALGGISALSGNVNNGLFCADVASVASCDAHGTSSLEGQTGSSYAQHCTTTTSFLIFSTTKCDPAPTGPQTVNTSGWLSGKTISTLDTGSSGYTCAIASGSLGCWGVNVKGQLGTGDTANKNVPTAVKL